MKRILALLLVTAMLMLALVSCNQGSVPTESGTETPSETDTPKETQKVTKPERTTPAFTGLSVSLTLEQALVSVSPSTVSDSGEPIDQSAPFGPSPHTTIEEAVGKRFQRESAVSGNFVPHTSQIYIALHFDNPKEFSIEKIVFDGVSYEAGSFEEGSSCTRVVIKISTDDEGIKRTVAMSGFEYKDNEGETRTGDIVGLVFAELTTVPTTLPTATVSEEKVMSYSLKINADISDPLCLLSRGESELYLAIFDGTRVIRCSELNDDGVNCEGSVYALDSNTVYQYAVVAIYDRLDGKGITPHVLYKSAFRTGMGGAGSAQGWDKLDFEGEKIGVLLTDENRLNREWLSDVDSDCALDVSIRNRNSKVAEDLNLSVERIYLSSEGWEYYSLSSRMERMVQNDVLNGIGQIDITVKLGGTDHSSSSSDLYSNIRNEERFPYFDFGLPCWNQSYIDNATCGSHMYSCIGAMNLSVLDSTLVLRHNKTLYDSIKDESDPTDLLETAISGGWYYDSFYRYATLEEKVRNNTLEEDTFGLYLDGIEDPETSFSAIPYALGVKYSYETERETLVDMPGWKNALNHDFSPRVAALFWHETVVTPKRGEVTGFGSGRVLLAADKLYRSAEYAKTLSDMEDEIQILPWPKLDEKQTKYVTTAKGDMYITVVPNHKKATKGEAISAYLQYSNELAYVARDAYVYELLGIEDADDEVATATQRRMLDIIIDSTSFDAADIYADLNWRYDTVDNCWAYNMIDANDRYDFKRISGDTKIFGDFSFQTIP